VTREYEAALDSIAAAAQEYEATLERIAKSEAAAREYEAALDGIARYFEIADRERLGELVDWARSGPVARPFAYHHDQVPDTLDELDAASRRVVELLEDSTNFVRLQLTLEEAGVDPDAFRSLYGDLGSLSRATAWLDDALRELFDPASAGRALHELTMRLDLVRATARYAHRKRGRGQPRDRDLHDLVDALADYWVDELGKPFTQDWYTDPKKARTPQTKAAEFVVAVIGLIAPTRLPEVPTVTKNIVRERRRLSNNRT
jgi:hypothetical protein